jgi:hypothetical protein
MESFHGEELLVPRPTSMLEDHTLSAARNDTFSATLRIGHRFSIGNLRTRQPRFITMKPQYDKHYAV